MERTQIDGEHDYLLTPGEYPISDNNAHSTYDQFIQLRDTLVFSNKYYADSAGRSLIIGTKLNGEATGTIEIREPNMVRTAFEPTGVAVPTVLGKYVAVGGHTTTNPISCEIVKDGRYKLQHKEHFIDLANTSITRINSYIIQHKSDGTDVRRAVFDWERSEAGMFNRMTSFGYVECDLNKGDWLELKIKDQDGNDIPLSQLQADSNWWMVEYIDLIYN